MLAALITPAGGAVLAVAGLVTLGAALLGQRAAGDGTQLTTAAGQRDQRVTGLIDGLAELVSYGAMADAIDSIEQAETCFERATVGSVLAKNEKSIG